MVSALTAERFLEVLDEPFPASNNSSPGIDLPRDRLLVELP
jgi:hypothetical protein